MLEPGKSAFDSINPEDGQVLPPGIPGEHGDLWIFPSQANPPSWVGTLLAYWPHAPLAQILSSRGGAIVSYQAAGRNFLLTFGTGYLYVNKDNVVRDFGRRAVVNCVHPNELRQVSRQAIEGNNLQAIEQTPRSSSISAYGIDIERDLLKGLAGKPRKSIFGKFLAGSDSLHGKIDQGLDHLIRITRLYLRAYQQKIISEDLKWVDRLKKEVDPSTLAVLSKRLDSAISGDSKLLRPVLGLPEIIDLSLNPTFTFEKNRLNNAPATYLDPSFEDWKQWYAAHKGNPTTLVAASSAFLFIHMGGVNNKIKISIVRCLTWMTRYKSKTYLFHDKTWYAIDDSLVKDVTNFIKNIYKRKSGITWPKYYGGTEDSYNKAAVKAITTHHLDNLDKSNITLRGARTAIEPCDLFEPQSRHLIYVKRKKSGSEGLAHLLTQAQVGVETFMSHDDEMRRKMLDKIPNKPSFFDPSAQPNPTEWTVVILICGVNAKRGLPFFTYMAVKRVIQTLESRFGLTVCLEYS